MTAIAIVCFVFALLFLGTTILLAVLLDQHISRGMVESLRHWKYERAVLDIDRLVTDNKLDGVTVSAVLEELVAKLREEGFNHLLVSVEERRPRQLQLPIEKT